MTRVLAPDRPDSERRPGAGTRHRGKYRIPDGEVRQMAAESAFNRSAMAQAAVQVEDAVGQIRGQQSQLAGQHGDLMAGWQGEAATAFTSAYESFNSDFSQVL